MPLGFRFTSGQISADLVPADWHARGIEQRAGPAPLIVEDPHLPSPTKPPPHFEETPMTTERQAPPPQVRGTTRKDTTKIGSRKRKTGNNGKRYDIAWLKVTDIVPTWSPSHARLHS
ncbi:hypothetical protein NDU88_002004 [Pleurodeles waltl]|uniref:Uncharacterized protein n=1 Tax=Pleurodeles waltl TaxID=8319 RepID=A0AAV7Q7N3_PLEWA|nr:hypothetical protein NDU88_002004 [Pleurodeles waltl]